ncbi:MAG: sugar ABC transporter permease [Ruminiclostridium sp.]|nr:sugar ABC transporter permease [Ruminiclostridium sp.]
MGIEDSYDVATNAHACGYIVIRKTGREIMIKTRQNIALTKNSSWTNSLYKHRFLYLMVFPAVIATIIFSYIPLFGWIIAFKNYRIGLSIWKAPWTGFYQFKRFFIQGDDLVNLLRNTLITNISSLVFSLVFACAFAILLSELRYKKLGKIVQTVSFFPFFISWVTIYTILHALFAVTSGAVSMALVDVGLLKKGINFLGDERFSWVLAVVVQVWKSLGCNSVIFLASISGIPLEQYEAAEIDGAGRCGKIYYVTLPNLMPTLIVLMIMNIGWILSSNLDLFYLLTNPTNRRTMEVLDMYIYRYGLQLNDFSYATAIDIIKTVVGLILVTSANALSRMYTGKSIL